MAGTGVKQAIIVGLSYGGYVTSVLAAYHPDRVRAAILIGTVATVGPGYPYLAREHFRAERQRFEGWDKYNRHYWLQNYPDFAEHFIRQMYPEPHSTKQIEDGIAWACDTTGEILIKTVEVRFIPPGFDVGEAMYRKISCPMLVIHGAQDYRVPDSQGLSVFTALQRRGIPSELLYFPNENHWVLKPADSIQWYDTVFAWLKRWTGAP